MLCKSQRAASGHRHSWDHIVQQPEPGSTRFHTAEHTLCIWTGSSMCVSELVTRACV